jgi:hypothetical protein
MPPKGEYVVTHGVWPAGTAAMSVSATVHELDSSRLSGMPVTVAVVPVAVLIVAVVLYIGSVQVTEKVKVPPAQAPAPTTVLVIVRLPVGGVVPQGEMLADFALLLDCWTR